MSIFIKDLYATIWKVEPIEGTRMADVQMSTSRKDKEGKYINSSWSFVKFVGQAYEKIDLLGRGTHIKINAANISKEPYEKDGEKQYPKYPRITVFNFELSDGKNNPNKNPDNESALPENEVPFDSNDTDDEMPF